MSRFTCCLILLLAAAPSSAAAPNVVYFLADDLGWADVGWHGKQIKTPNLDKLAAKGAKLEHFYAQPLCSPTRAALLTGRYPMRYGLQTGVVRPWAQYGLPLEERLLPQALKDAGYRTAIVGKWHLGHFKRDYLPTRRGFDHQYGQYNGAIDYNTHVRDGGFDWHKDDKVCRDEGYTTHLLAKEAVRLINDHDGKKPLFLYVAFNAPHAPYQVPEKYTKPYAALEGQRRKFAGMIAALDEAVGQIVDAIDRKKLTKDTLFLFSSDNGGVQPDKVASNVPLRGGKATLYEGGVRVPAFASWQGKIKPGTVVNEPIHLVDWFPTLVNLAGGSLKQKLPLDGKDVWPTITQGKPSPHEAILLNAAPGGGAIRAGDWKLIVGSPQSAGGEGKAKGKKDNVELYNLKDDPGEKKNVAPDESDRVKKLRALYDAYAKTMATPLSKPMPEGFKSPKVWGED
jgi:arylsulfatase A-like enzyme